MLTWCWQTRFCSDMALDLFSGNLPTDQFGFLDSLVGFLFARNPHYGKDARQSKWSKGSLQLPRSGWKIPTQDDNDDVGFSFSFRSGSSFVGVIKIRARPRHLKRGEKTGIRFKEVVQNVFIYLLSVAGADGKADGTGLSFSNFVVFD